MAAKSKTINLETYISVHKWRSAIRNYFFHILLILVLTGMPACTDQFTNPESVEPSASISDAFQETFKLQSEVPDPEQLFLEFIEMAESVRAMEPEELENLTPEEADSIGQAIRNVTDDTIFISPQVLKRISVPLTELAENAALISETGHQTITTRVLEKITPMAGFIVSRRSLTSEQIKELLIEIHAADPEEGAGCELLFNKSEDHVLLFKNDNFAVANAACQAGTAFFLMPGIHERQKVYPSKTGNSWIGLHGALMDGLNRTGTAFDGNFEDHLFAFFEIKNYDEFGIVDKTGISENVIIRKMVFRNIGEHLNGQTYGAVKFLESRNIEIRESYFENVTSAIRFSNSFGPLKVLHNDALNPGRNFFQCDKCTGPEIHIIANSLVNTGGFGADKLEDFINIFASEGEEESPIRVNYNRARTNGVNLSPSGSFIILGDFGGRYQEAKENIGVNPGQVGIGAASGDYILVENNRMYSSLIEGISNTAYYSWKTPDHAPECSNHTFVGNSANWTCGRTGVCKYGQLNRAWSPGNCGLTNEAIRENTVDDLLMGPDVWNDLFTRSDKKQHNRGFGKDRFPFYDHPEKEPGESTIRRSPHSQ